MMGDDGRKSPFAYGMDATEIDEIDVSQLLLVVERHFKTRNCSLRRLANGCYHKVYDILGLNGVSLGAVVRVASPAFPKDKLESEVATYRLLADSTSIPLPRIHTYNSDASNPVGAEYMIMDKVRGTPAANVWDVLPMNIKLTVVAQIARYFMEIFCLRFPVAGSIYHDPEPPHFFVIGPIVSEPFYRAIDGEVREPMDDSPHLPDPDPNRGPYSSVSEYLSGGYRRELEYVALYRDLALSEVDPFVKIHNDEERTLERAVGVIKKLIELRHLYPGDVLLPANIITPQTPFSLRLKNLQLSDIMIDIQTGRVTGLIDLEATTISPVWECAEIPRWLGNFRDIDYPYASYEGGPKEEREVLRAAFFSVMQQSIRYQEWREAYDVGRPFREFHRPFLNSRVVHWAPGIMERWVDRRLEWARAHPGVAIPASIRASDHEDSESD